MWIFDLPLWLSALVIIVVFSAYALGAMTYVHGRVLPRVHFGPHDSEYASTILHSVIGFYGLVTALIAVSVWARHGSVGEAAANEATAVAMVWRDVSGYPSPIREQLRDQLRDYTEDAIQVAWPKMRKGILPTAGVQFLDDFQTILFKFEPANESQRSLHDETLRAYNEMVRARRLRLDMVGKGLPGVLWLLVLGGAAIILFLVMLNKVDHRKLQTFLVVCLATFMAMVVFVILALDQPYRGQLGVPPSALRLVHDQLMMH